MNKYYSKLLALSLLLVPATVFSAGNEAKETTSKEIVVNGKKLLFVQTEAAKVTSAVTDGVEFTTTTNVKVHTGIINKVTSWANSFGSWAKSNWASAKNNVAQATTTTAAVAAGSLAIQKAKASIKFVIENLEPVIMGMMITAAANHIIWRYKWKFNTYHNFDLRYFRHRISLLGATDLFPHYS